MNPQLESFRYDDAIVRKFLWATFIWGLIGMMVGLLIALQLAVPALNFDIPLAQLRPAPPAAHQRGDLRVRGQRDLHRRVLLHRSACSRRGCSATCSARSTSGAGS